MSEFVAITAFPDANVSFKREALIFQRIGVHNLKADLNKFRSRGATHEGGLFETLEWLLEQDVLFEPELMVRDIHTNADSELNRYLKDYRNHQKKDKELESKFLTSLHNTNTDPMDTIRLFFEGALAMMDASDTLSRILSVQLRKSHNMDAHALVKSSSLSSNSSIGAHTTLGIVLNAMPVPSESVSWEQILEYRSDPDSWTKFLSLRNWMNEVARANLTPIEVEQKLEYLMNQYQRHMEVHKMKTSVGTLETVVTATAELAEDLVKFKWGKIAKGLFAFKQRKVALLEGELKAPGAEVAFIVKTKQQFLRSE
jgi:hypothetical protein